VEANGGTITAENDAGRDVPRELPEERLSRRRARPLCSSRNTEVRGMTTRSLVWILLLLGTGWLLILSPGLFSYWSILRHADGYRRAEYLVTGGNCISGGSGGRTTRSAPRCFLEGKVLLDGGRTSKDEELSVGSSLTHPAGARIAVFYNPALPSVGPNELPQRVLQVEDGPDPASLARRWLRAAARIVLLALGSAVLVHVLLRTGTGRLAHGPRELAVDLGGGQAAVGTVLSSQGLSFLVGQIPDPAVGGIVLGLILVGAGVPLLVRRFVVFAKDDERATRGRHLLGLPFARRQESLPAVAKVSLESSGGRIGIVMTGPAVSERSEASEARATALERARRIADFFGATLEDTTDRLPASPSAARRVAGRTLRRLAVRGAFVVALLVGAVAAVELVPGLRLSLATTILEPFGMTRQIGLARRWALARLVSDPSPAALLQLLRVLNTLDAERFPEIAADVDAAASRRAGLAPVAELDRAARIRAVNEWAAAQLGRALDANGGVLGWMPVAERFVPPIERIAGADVNDAWLGWNHFAAGELVTPEQFVYAVGPALADARPISFAIYRNGRLFEGQPVPIDSRPDVLAHTVGEALALRLWLKEGVGDERFPDDFGVWWAQWARAHRLPPVHP
jgi:hypothetical protein